MKTLYKLSTAALLLSVSLTSCYKDLGHYDYKDLRQVSVTFSPENYSLDSIRKIVLFTVEQPTEPDTLDIDAHTFINGSNETNGDDLTVMWYNPYKNPNDRDTIFTLNTRVAIKAKAATDTTFMLQVNDKTTTLDYYYQVRVKTVIPYMNSWVVLHGMPEDMKIGNAERKGDYVKSHPDIYYSLFGRHRFEKASGLMYAETANGWSHGEVLGVYGGDSLFMCNPFNFRIYKNYEAVMPDQPYRQDFISGAADGFRRSFYLIGSDHKIYISAYHLFLYEIKGDQDLLDYHASDIQELRNKFYVWDDVAKTLYRITNFSLFSFTRWKKGRQDDRNRGLVTAFPQDLFSQDSFKGLTFIGFTPFKWSRKVEVIGLMFKNDSGENVMGQLTISNDDSGNGYQFKMIEMPGMLLKKSHLTATCSRFPNMIYYASDNAIYQYDIEQKQNRLIYEAPDNATINNILFKSTDNDYDPILVKYYGEDYPFTFTLGVSVNYPDNTGEVREILLNSAGEVNKVYTIKGFEHIKDMIFSVVNSKY